MTHVFFNLLKNAVYYVEAANQGGIDIRVETGDKFNKVYFKDTGTGIPAKSLPHIFERFYTTTDNGTGIGLAFCQLVMQSFGGDISCQSTEGQYTEFTLKFPKIRTIVNRP